MKQKEIGIVPDPVGQLKVMTWNIRFSIGRLPFFGDSCGDRTIFTEDEVITTLERIVAKIIQVNPDIILMQEVDRESKRTAYVDQVQWILDHTEMNYAAYASMWKAQTIPSDGIGRMDVGNVVMSKWPFKSTERIQLPLRTDQDALTKMFYLRRNILKTNIDLPTVGHNNFYVVNIHATAFATDDTKQKHIDKFLTVLDDISDNNPVVAGGDLNSIPPGSAFDFCLADSCEGESFHTDTDGGPHREGSYFNFFENEPIILQPLYDAYNTAIPLEEAITSSHSTHSTSGDRLWNRKLDYIFTNLDIIPGSGVTHQETMEISDHAPVTVFISLE